MKKEYKNEKLLIEFADAKNFRWHTYHDLLQFARDNKAYFEAFALTRRKRK